MRGGGGRWRVVWSIYGAGGRIYSGKGGNTRYVRGAATRCCTGFRRAENIAGGKSSDLPYCAARRFTRRRSQLLALANVYEPVV